MLIAYTKATTFQLNYLIGRLFRNFRVKRGGAGTGLENVRSYVGFLSATIRPPAKGITISIFRIRGNIISRATRTKRNGWLEGAFAAMLLAVAAVTPARGAEPDAGPATNLQLQIAYIYQFTNFIRWPDSAFEGGVTPLRICLAVSPATAPYYQPLAQRSSGARRIDLITTSNPARQERCHMLVVEKKHLSSVDATLESWARDPVLTISDDEQFAARGGMIAFVTVGKRVRINVNLPAIKAARLEISAKLLEVANRVYNEK